MKTQPIVRVTWLTTILTMVFGVAIIVVVYDRHISDARLGFYGGLLGGAIGGLMTLIGVLLTIGLAQHDRDSAARRSKVNQARLLHGELSTNRLVVHRFLERSNRRILVHLRDDVWNRLNTEVYWLDTSLFEKLFATYEVFRIIRNAHETLDQKDGFISSGNVNLRQCEQDIEELLLRLQDIVELSEV